MLATCLGVHLLTDEFWYHFLAGDEVDEGDIRDFDDQGTQERDEVTELHEVAYDLGHAEEGCFQGCGAGGDEGCRGMGQEVKGLSIDDFHLVVPHIFLIELGLDVGRSGDDEAVAVGEGFGSCQHPRQVVTNLMRAATAEQGDEGEGGG